MLDIWIAFITGLTAGGLSCMAVHGGLLTSSLASQLEKDFQNQPHTKQSRPQLAAPITVFLLAKLAAYTLLGFLLGLVGSTLSLTPLMRALLQFAIGIFMIGNALRMFNVHPIFRYFNFETPSFITRFIRKSSKGKTAFAAPVFLGAMTVLIPCGIAQSMMAVALGSANPLIGAAIMFAFTLGASPAFFALTYFAARMGAMLEKYFMRLVAIVLLLLGVYAIDTGLNMVGSPYSLSNTVQTLTSPASAAESEGPAADLTLYAHDDGYTPRTLNALAGQPLKLQVVTKNTTSCALAFTIPELNVAKDLPVTGNVVLDIPAQPQGKVMRFSCSMGMYTGQIVFK
ncbi:MAG: sulfite exporter TauE/SafE family protein [Chloroflexi bacterium]|nr:sulfite exporter TauE/SafE family protein [Chloroflexota bacterium]